MVDSLVKSPRINPRPIAVNPHTFKKSTTFKRPGLEAIDSKRPENIPPESNKYTAEVQFGLRILLIPSYKKCQPIKTLKETSIVNCQGE